MGNAVHKLRARMAAAQQAERRGLPPDVVLYHERSRSPDGRKSSTGSSSDASWSSAHEEVLDSSLEDALDPLNDPDGALVSLLARAGEDDFMKVVLEFCAYMGGRMDSLDNARLYDEFRSFTRTSQSKVGVA
ncbi:uncharacterized protein LOC143027649 [Oratosquilla oratoria]|uniref:uncharacterized protein LOC143027649 n=1 Tax=Oratosquilla oratoria TaxID=337810 RepID=UPI003F76B380